MMAVSIAVAVVPALAGGSARANDAMLARIEGRYAVSRMLQEIGGARQNATDELLLARKSATEAWFRVQLFGGNLHVCTLAGVANVEGPRLVYRDKDASETCRLSIEFGRGRVSFRDPGNSCRTYCGAHVAFDGISMPLSIRQRFDAAGRAAALRRIQDDIE
jgi:hypothetical protein